MEPEALKIKVNKQITSKESTVISCPNAENGNDYLNYPRTGLVSHVRRSRQGICLQSSKDAETALSRNNVCISLGTLWNFNGENKIGLEWQSREINIYNSFAIRDVRIYVFANTSKPIEALLHADSDNIFFILHDVLVSNIHHLFCLQA